MPLVQLLDAEVHAFLVDTITYRTDISLESTGYLKHM